MNQSRISDLHPCGTYSPWAHRQLMSSPRLDTIRCQHHVRKPLKMWFQRPYVRYQCIRCESRLHQSVRFGTCHVYDQSCSVTYISFRFPEMCMQCLVALESHANFTTESIKKRTKGALFRAGFTNLSDLVHATCTTRVAVSHIFHFDSLRCVCSAWWRWNLMQILQQNQSRKEPREHFPEQASPICEKRYMPCVMRPIHENSHQLSWECAPVMFWRANSEQLRWQ